MDTSVALVQAYLHVNGYFTVVEYPVLEAFRSGQARAVTDLDVLAFRFAGAGHDVVRGRGHRPLGGRALTPDPLLDCPVDRPDMIVGEVKEGAARLNAAMTDPAVLEVALARFGCCPPDHATTLTHQLLTQGHVISPAGHAIRLVAFGDTPDSRRRGPWATIPMRHVVQFLRAYLKEHWEVLRHAQFRDPALGVLALIEQWGVDALDGQAPRNRIKEQTHGGVRVHRRS
ncbi:MAG: hypothetical protein ABL986_20400 [Vicinamibacterales bacterium]